MKIKVKIATRVFFNSHIFPGRYCYIGVYRVTNLKEWIVYNERLYIIITDSVKQRRHK